VATSVSWNYQATAAIIINAAAEDLGVIETSGTLTSGDFASMLTRLNLLAKQWQGKSDMAQGLKIWTRQRLSVFLTNGQVRYLVGPASSDDRASVNSLSTTLGAAKAANATSITVASTTGMTAADQIGVVTDAGTIGWNTITSVDSGTTLTVPANTVGDAASGNVVYTYTSKAQRFVDIEYAVLRDNSQAGQPIDLPIRIYTDVQEYESLPQKYAEGDPLAILVEPSRLNTVVTTNFNPPNVYKNLRLTVFYPAEDYDDSTGADDISFPQEWFAALEWELALRCAPMFGAAWTKEMQMNHAQSTTIARELNPQNTSSYFQPNAESYDHR
jgi:hypothetical protein